MEVEQILFGKGLEPQYLKFKLSTPISINSCTINAIVPNFDGILNRPRRVDYYEQLELYTSRWIMDSLPYIEGVCIPLEPSEP